MACAALNQKLGVPADGRRSTGLPLPRFGFAHRRLYPTDSQTARNLRESPFSIGVDVREALRVLMLYKQVT
jgi:hypothetical protein